MGKLIIRRGEKFLTSSRKPDEAVKIAAEHRAVIEESIQRGEAPFRGWDVHTRDYTVGRGAGQKPRSMYAVILVPPHLKDVPVIQPDTKGDVMPRPPAREVAVNEALARAAQSESAKLPKRFTSEGNDAYRTITDTTTGRTSEVMLTCFGTVRRVLSELFPDSTPGV